MNIAILPNSVTFRTGSLTNDQVHAVFAAMRESIEPIIGGTPLSIEFYDPDREGPITGEDVADRIEAVRDELKAIRVELAPTGNAPHDELHDVVKEAQRVFTVHEGDLSVYLRDLRA